MYIYYAPGCRHATIDRTAYLVFLRTHQVNEKAIQSLVIRVKSDLSEREYRVLNKGRRARYGAAYRCPPVAGLMEHSIEGVKRPRITLCLDHTHAPNETLLHETGHLVESYAPANTSPASKSREQQLAQQYTEKRANSPDNAYWYLPTEVKARAFSQNHVKTHRFVAPIRHNPPPRSSPQPTVSPAQPEQTQNQRATISPVVVIGYLALQLASRGIRRLFSSS